MPKKPKTNRHGEVAAHRRRISYIEEVEVYDDFVFIAKKMHITVSNLIREATARFMEEVKANGGRIEFKTDLEN